jgi:hypothetical protein
MVSLWLRNEVYIHTILARGLINHVAQNKATRKGMTEVISIDQKKNHPVTEDKQQLTSTYSDSTISSLDNSRKYGNNNNHKNTIYDLDLPYGLIDLLIDNNFTLDSLINANPSELSCILAIDQEVATIIWNAANMKDSKRKRHIKRLKMTAAALCIAEVKK